MNYSANGGGALINYRTARRRAGEAGQWAPTFPLVLTPRGRDQLGGGWARIKGRGRDRTGFLQERRILVVILGRQFARQT